MYQLLTIEVIGNEQNKIGYLKYKYRPQLVSCPLSF